MGVNAQLLQTARNQTPIYNTAADMAQTRGYSLGCPFLLEDPLFLGDPESRRNKYLN